MMDEIRKKLAELQGFSFVEEDGFCKLYKDGDDISTEGDEDFVTFKDWFDVYWENDKSQPVIPPLDDNLIDRLVRELSEYKLARYMDILWEVVAEKYSSRIFMWIMIATVEQKARAYIATMEEK